MRKQIIYLITSGEFYTAHQLDEVDRILKRYDIKIIPNIIAENEDDIKRLLESDDPEIEVIAALSIQRKINIDSEVPSNNPGSFLCATDDCIIHAYKLMDGNLICKDFHYTTEGYISNLLKNMPDIISELDNNFFLKNSLLTYNELDQHHMRNTSQGIALSKFVCDELYYPTSINLNFNPQNQIRTIDFNNDPAKLLDNNIYFNNSVAVDYGITKIFHTVINRGIFIRKPKNRREKNYWCPALNAGLPLVPKRDVVHEVTYMAHDFSHFLIPDLLYTGQHSETTQQIYIAYRMMSEAFTLVLADMVFVDSLCKSGFQYDYTKRKIYPLFEDFEIDLTQKDTFFYHLEKMLIGSVYYCLKGDDSHFVKLSQKYRPHSPNLENFKTKYMKFFCEDFKWTRNNYNYFRNNSKEIQRWWTLVSPLRQMAQLDTETIDEFASKMELQSNCLIENIFAVIYPRVKATLASNSVTIEVFEKRQLKAFFRYMMGQLLLFVRYENVVREAKVFQKIIIHYLADIHDKIKPENIEFCRSIMTDFIDILLSKNLIHYDDALTFKEVFPVFEPSFAFYDERREFYRELSVVAHESIYSQENSL